MTMLEKAARAVGSVVLGPDERGGPVFPDYYTALELARAVLMAVREPSDDLANKACQPIADTVPFNPCPREAFTAMIDAILSEGQP